MTSPQGGGVSGGFDGWRTGAARGSGPSLNAPGDRPWRMRGGTISMDGPAVMGIVNLTPDSFSDGGRFRDVEEAVDVAHAMVAAGAALIDVGGESTRPGAQTVPAGEEMARVLPFLQRVEGRLGVPVSVDTRKAAVARVALEAGAAVVNDVSGLAFDPSLAEVVAEAGAGVVLMHMRGKPANMADFAHYAGLAQEVAVELSIAVERARAAGIPDDAVVLDPGLGFAKDAHQSLALLSDLGPLRALGFPLLVGPSRKSFLSAVTGASAADGLPGTLAACVAAYFEGARVFRVHDVGPVVQALAVAQALEGARTGDAGEQER